MKSRSVLLPIILAAAGNVWIATAQSPGTFTATGNMTTPRYGHTATLLFDGEVLITGGDACCDSSVLATAELYNPATGMFTATGEMTTPRVGHTATLLADGEVLIAGGARACPWCDGTNDILASAELYDPSTGTFTATGNMITAQLWHTATLLGTGKVLIAGGTADANALKIAAAELFDPTTGEFSPAGTYASTNSAGGPLLPTATLLGNGKVLIAGWGVAELFDPADGTFHVTGSPQMSRWSASLLMNGEVLYAGGNDDPGADIGAELYDSSTGTFAATGNLNTARLTDTANLLADGTVIVTGGSQLHLAYAELYDAPTGTFSVTGELAPDRGLHTATLLNSGQVLIAGGFVQTELSANDHATADAELYNPRLLVAAPVLFSLSRDGRGQGAIWDTTTGQLASPSSPAIAGEILSMYTTSLFEGGAIPPQVAIGGKLAEILYFGGAPGYPGYNQVNFRVPGGVAPGPAVPVRLTYVGRPSNAVTIGVQ